MNQNLLFENFQKANPKGGNGMNQHEDGSGGIGWMHVVGGTLLGLVPSWIKSRAQERAAIADQVAQCLIRVNILEKRIDDKEAEISRLHERIDAKDSEVKSLEAQLEKAELDRDAFRVELDTTQAKVVALENHACMVPLSDRPDECPCKGAALGK